MSATADTCPKCGFSRAPGAVECPACGIVYERYLAAYRPAAAGAAGVTDAPAAPPSSPGRFPPPFTDPYAPPQATVQGPPGVSWSAGADYGPLTAAMVDHLVKTKGWARLVSVMTFIGAGFMVLAGLGLAVAGSAGLGNQPGGAAAGLIGGVYLVLAVIYCVPAIALSGYATAIGRIQPGSAATEAVEVALDRQRSFWRTIGIMMLVGIALMAVMFFVGMGAAVFSAIKK